MEFNSIDRRSFLKTAGAATALIGMSGKLSLASTAVAGISNQIPRWRGFNLLDYFGPIAQKGNSSEATNDVLNIDEKVVDEIVRLIELANKYKLHVSLNLHRAPVYCVNAGFNEPYNLWKDEAAQEAFKFHWEMWAKRLKDVSREKVSFDLVNEPSLRENMNDQFGDRKSVPGGIDRKVAKEPAEAIRKYNSSRIVVADGNDVGSSVIPEITDLDIAQSCRGYFPHYISHYRA